MWSNWSETAKASLSQALEKTNEALEKTGDAISKAATTHSHNHAKKNPPTGTVVDLPPPATPTAAAVTEQAERKIVEEEEKRTAAVAGIASLFGSATATATGTPPEAATQQLLGNLQAGWSTVVERTHTGLAVASHTVVEQQQRLAEKVKQQSGRGFFKRDLALPLDVVALREAQVVYLTDRLICMAHPAASIGSPNEQQSHNLTSARKLAAVGHMLQKRHGGGHMVWNVSEVEYETRIFDDQVLTFSFPGSPSPPLGLLLKLLISMEAWLKADAKNVAVVHCLTGKGRTSLILAAFLCWMGEAGFTTMPQALAYIAACKQIPGGPDALTIPSQRRYATYFSNMLDSVRPSQPPLLLKRIVLSEAPRYAEGPARTDLKNSPEQRMGCAPYVQIFKAGQLLHTAAAQLHFSQDETELQFVQVADGAVTFHIDRVVQGDILVRCRHMMSNGKKRISMFRAAIHTGYVPPKLLRLKKSELDGACSDDKHYPDDFFVDLIFEPLDAEEASKLMKQDQTPEVKEMTVSTSPAAATSGSQAAAALAGGATTVTASTYDSMLHRDSRFWDVIAARRQEQAAATSTTNDAKNEQDPLWGRTIGRRRDFDNPTRSPVKATANKEKKAALETFSIGGELDFLPADGDDDDDGEAPPSPKKDTLMEALMGALGEEEQQQPRAETEVVIFESASESSSVAVPSEQGVGGEDSAATSVTEGETAVMSAANSTTTEDADVVALLADAALNLDDDVNALLDEAGGLDALGSDDGEFDIDDSELEDLENLLASG